jgi:dipeptidase D
MVQHASKILDYFQQINEIPRCSKKEEQIARWLIQWAENRHLPAKMDAAGNLVVSVKPSAGYEQAPTVIIQGHMDMVCEKAPDSNHDFSKDPIRHIFDGDWLHADNTTLGADNGIAVAMALTVADDESLLHPPLELLITVDEETGLNGAKLLEPGFIEGRILLNIDSETDGVFTVGCAGGRNTHISRKLTFADLAEDAQLFGLTVRGLHGGHSGIDIHKQRANANKILARALQQISASCSIRLVSIKGGTAHNAIPRDAETVFACPASDTAKLDKIIGRLEETVQSEYETIDPSLTVDLRPDNGGKEEVKVLSVKDTRMVVDLLLCVPHGVMGMSSVFKGVVETSNNMATVEFKDDNLQILTSQRSSVMSRMDEVTATIKAAAGLANAVTKSDSEFAPWTPDMQSPLLKRCKRVYRQVSGRDAEVESIHAGLECAIIGNKYPGMDMISFGPTLKDAHSPNEKLSVPSVGRVWDFLVALLESYKR